MLAEQIEHLDDFIQELSSSKGYAPMDLDAANV